MIPRHLICPHFIALAWPQDNPQSSHISRRVLHERRSGISPNRSFLFISMTFHEMFLCKSHSQRTFQDLNMRGTISCSMRSAFPPPFARLQQCVALYYYWRCSELEAWPEVTSAAFAPHYLKPPPQPRPCQASFLTTPSCVAMEISMNSMKLVTSLHSLYRSIHTKDESKRGTAFAFIFGVN